MTLPIAGLPPPPVYVFALWPQGRSGVQRDMELIREICRAINARSDIKGRTVEVEGYDAWVIQHHVDMLYQAGFIQGASTTNLSTGVPTVLVRDFTWEGHEFAAALLNDTVWNRVKTQVAPEILMRTPLKVISAALQEVAGAVLKHHVGLGT